MSDVLASTKVVVYVHDIRIWGKIVEEHEENLAEVLAVLHRMGMHVNKDKV